MAAHGLRECHSFERIRQIRSLLLPLPPSSLALFAWLLYPPSSNLMQRSHVLRMHRLRKVAVIVCSFIRSSGYRLRHCPNLIFQGPCSRAQICFVFVLECLSFPYINVSCQIRVSAISMPRYSRLCAYLQVIARVCAVAYDDILHPSDILLQYICAKHVPCQSCRTFYQM